jgi:tripartite ATP-independent transporter DctM subunit
MLILFGVFFILLLIGTPISFSMLISSVLFMITNNIPLVMVIPRVSAGVDSFPLLAVGFFVLAGNIMNLGGVTTRIFSWADHLVGHYTGGLAHSNVLASVIFSGMSGSAIADTGGLGAIELKAMKAGGYDEDFSLAVTGASSLIGPIIPPSVPLIIFGVAAGVSIGDLFNSGLLPGLILAIMMMVLNYFICKKKDYKKRKKATGKEIWAVTKWAFWALLLPIIIRGGIAFGVFTPTEASIIAVVYGLILGFAYKDIKLKDIPTMLLDTIQVTVGVLFIIASATLFSWILTYTQVPQKVSTSLLNLTTNPFYALLLIVGILLVIGCFIDLTPAIVIMTPVFMPFITQLGINPVLFGLLMVLCLLVGLVTPPVGMVLFVLSGVSGVGVERISKAIIPYIIASLGVILLLVVYICMVRANPNIPLIY